MLPATLSAKAGSNNITTRFLRGKDGYRKVIVDSRGRVKREIEIVEPQAGQDLVTTIDLDLQMAAEEQLAQSVTKRGTIIAMDPNNGEILVMASPPSFDPNVFVTGSTTPEGRKQIAAYYTTAETVRYNRAIQGRYPPGSTWKIPESVAGLAAGRDHGQKFQRRLRRRHHRSATNLRAVSGQSRRAADFATRSRIPATVIITVWL